MDNIIVALKTRRKTAKRSLSKWARDFETEHSREATRDEMLTSMEFQNYRDISSIYRDYDLVTLCLDEHMTQLHQVLEASQMSDETSMNSIQSSIKSESTLASKRSTGSGRMRPSRSRKDGNKNDPGLEKIKRSTNIYRK